MAAAPAEVGALLATIFVGSSLLVIVRAWARKIENQSKLPKAPAGSAERFERMERAIDSVALEVERISENQRFLTKLLSERADAGRAAATEFVEGERAMSEDVLVVGIVFGSITSVLVLFPIVRAWARRIDARSQAPSAVPADVTERLERIERAVESVALEVERISEGQRFVTKVLAGRGEPRQLPLVQD